jgi:uncharacterized Zn finger protein
MDADAPRGPIPVEGGLVARSSRGGIGREWWSRRFIAVMESFALGGRLTRGKKYARDGQVKSLDVESGVVAAVVQGSRPAPYRVGIKLKPFSELAWAKAEVALAEQAIFSARLLAGEFPAELEPVFDEVGVSLFPTRLSELTMSCSCPDHAVPCKHLAATFYLLAERFDDDPFQILHWRGRPRATLLGRLRELRGDQPGPMLEDGEPEGAPELRPVPGAALALADPTPDAGPVRRRTAATSRVESFWTAPPALPLPTHPDLPADLLLRSLPEPSGALGGSGLLAFLAPVYERLAPVPAPSQERITRRRGRSGPRATGGSRTGPLEGDTNRP